MNIWRLDKDEKIKLLLLLLQQQFDLSKLKLMTEDLNAQAIRFTDPEIPELSAYIYSYGQDENRYGIHLELPTLNNFRSITPEGYENISVDRLAELLEIHLSLERTTRPSPRNSL